MWETLRSTLAPFLWGGALALVMNLPLTRLEKRLSGLRPRLRRAMALGLLTVGILGGLCLGVGLLIPQLVRAGAGIQRDFGQLRAELAALLGPVGRSLQAAPADAVQPLVQLGVTLARSCAQTLMQVGLGLVLALYLLASKESSLARGRRVCLALWGEARTRQIETAARQAAQVFGGFVVGQCLEACILAGLFLVTLWVLGFPLALPISAVIGVTALVPVFGAWVGGAAGALLLVSGGMRPALEFIAVFLLVQQLENQLLYPRVVGARIGLPPLWVLAGVLLGSGLLGPAGLFFGIPLMGVVYDQGRRWVHFRLDKPDQV